MLPFIIAGAVVAYLLDDASSSNKKARRDYDDTCDKAKEWLEYKEKHARRKDALDKLFKVKRAKQKVGNAIYSELKETQQAFKDINNRIKESKKILSKLFMQKRLSDSRAKKRELQEEINLIITSRKKLFSTKEILHQNIKELKERLKVANGETRMVQEQINKL